MAYLEATLPPPSDAPASDSAAPASVISVQVYLAKPLVELPADVVPTLAPLDILPLRELVPKKPPRDVEAEFQKVRRPNKHTQTRDKHRQKITPSAVSLIPTRSLYN
jgi:hypothetical protein